jgi:hypothetical protein
MPTLKSYKRIITQDYEAEQEKLIEQLGGTINDAFNDVYFVLTGKTDLRTNIACTVKDVEVSVNATGAPINRTVFTVKNPTTPVIGITVIFAQNQTNSAVYPTSQPFISFTPVEGGILINNITGLQPNQRYLVRLIAWN